MSFEDDLRRIDEHVAQARRLVQQHGGELGVSSEPDKGSTFRFTLPLMHPTEVAATSSAGVRTETPHEGPRSAR